MSEEPSQDIDKELMPFVAPCRELSYFAPFGWLKKGIADLLQKDAMIHNKYGDYSNFVSAFSQRIEKGSRGKDGGSIAQDFWNWLSPTFKSLYEKPEED